MLYEFDCSICGKIDSKSVAGLPKHPERMICSECERTVGDEPRYDMSAVRTAPRRKHNTRVLFNIICSSCKEEKNLDYVPKGVSMDEIQCNDCMDKNQEADARWRLVQEQKDKEQAKKDFPFICDGCGCEWSVPFRPKADRTYYCDACSPEDPDAEPDPNAPLAPRSTMPSTEQRMTDGMSRRRRKKKPPVTASWSTPRPVGSAVAAEVVEKLPGVDSTLEEPTAEEPTVEEPTVEEPTVEEPTVEEPTAEEPTVEEPTLEEPTAKEPTAKEPTVEVPD